MSNDVASLYIDLANHIVEYLRTRFHTEAPHIYILSPEYTVVSRIKLFRPQPSLGEYAEEGEGDFIPEVLADLLDPTKIRGHATHGVKATFRRFTDSSEISMETTFYIRIAPPTEFRRVRLATMLRRNKLGIRLIVEDEQGREIYNSNWYYKDFARNTFRAIVAVGWREVATGAAGVISRTLYPGAEIIELTDNDVVDALSTTESTRDGQQFLFLPPLRRGTHADSSNYFAVQNFLYEIEVMERNDEVKATFILRYIAPALIERNRRRFVRLSGGELGFPTYIYINDRRNRWSIHHLLEVWSKLSWKNTEPAWSWTRTLSDGRSYAGLYNLVPIGALAVEDDVCNTSTNCLLLRDWHIDIEKIYPIRRSPNTIEKVFPVLTDEVIRYAESRGINIDKIALREALNIVMRALGEAFPRIIYLYEFQERALAEGLKALLVGEHKAFVLQARTAGGKTLAFLLPILVYITYTKLARKDKEGVKAILFYPTTALQNDQVATIFSMLWHVNNVLRLKSLNIVTLGMLHGHTPRRHSTEERVAEERELRLRCPLCGQRLIISWETIPGTNNIRREVIKCRNSNCRINDPNTIEHQLLQEMIRGTRDAIYSSPPDLLIANPDIINARLTLMGREDPAALTILGKPAYICSRCGFIYDRRSRPQKCRRCGSRDLYYMKFAHPKIIVVDEAHLLRGAFGAQVSHVLTRLEQAIRKINNLNNEWRPIYFISSATLNNPRERTRELIATDPSNIIEISAQPERGVEIESTLRIHVFIMPKLYSPETTTSRIVEALYLEASALEKHYKARYNNRLLQLRRAVFGKRNPATLIFVNRISEANELLSFIRNFAHNVRSDGHTTDYKADRVRVEDEFSRGNLDTIVATSGLEVGVDFDRVDVGIIYGMPFYISDYTQRIGRIGRRQHSIIFNVFMPDKPIDHFYYRNWKLLSDGMLRDIHMRSEAYRINRENPEAVRRAAQRIVLDMLSVMPDMDRILYLSIMIQNRKFEQEVIRVLNQIKSEIVNYLPSALRIPKCQQAISIAQQFIDGIRSNLLVHGKLFSAIIRGLEASLRQLHSLRSLEPEVKYKFDPIDEERNRNMVYAFRHSLPGQIISYRSNFYVVDSFSGEAIYSSQRR